DVIFDEIVAVGVPAGIAVAAHIDGQNMEVADETRGNVVERVGYTTDAVQHDQRLAAFSAPIEIMNAHAVVAFDETIYRLRRQRSCELRGKQCCERGRSEAAKASHDVLRCVDFERLDAA